MTTIAEKYEHEESEESRRSVENHQHESKQKVASKIAKHEQSEAKPLKNDTNIIALQNAVEESKSAIVSE